MCSSREGYATGLHHMKNSYDLKIMPSIPDTTSFSYAMRVRIANPASVTKWLLLNRGIIMNR